MTFYILTGEITLIFRKKNGRTIAIPPKGKWSGKIEFKPENVNNLPDITGLYMFYDHSGKPLYIGHSDDGKHSGIKHRVQSYQEVDNFGKDEHPTKKALRPHISSFKFKQTSVSEAREIEKKLKQKMPYNMDNQKNEAKKHT